MQERLVPPKIAKTGLGAAGADLLKDVTYVSFDVEGTPPTLATLADQKS